MINNPTFVSNPPFCTTGTKTQAAAPRLLSGYVYRDQPPAEEHNFLFNGLTVNDQTAQTALLAMLAEMQQMITGTGFALDPTDNMQMEKADTARKHALGELVWFETKQTPVIYSAARSTTNPGFPAYLPVIARWDSDHDVTSAQAPDLVTAYRAEIATINVAGVSTASWTGTVAGSVITFATTVTNLALITMYANESNANGYIATQNAYFSPIFTGTAQRCINVNGTDYAVTGCSTGAYTITVSGTPTAGSQTCIPYTYRVAGSTTSIRLPRLAGMVGVVAFDYDGTFVSGWRKLDQSQGHVHNITSLLTDLQIQAAGSSWNFGRPAVVAPSTGPISDSTNGTPRVGKTTDPRAVGLLPYTWAGRLIA